MIFRSSISLFIAMLAAAQTPLEYDLIRQSLQVIQQTPAGSLVMMQSSGRPTSWRELLVADMDKVISTATVVKTTAASAANSIDVSAGGDFQAALNNAKPGGHIVLQAGATSSGYFTLPAKIGTAYITITTSVLASLPPEGQRVTPADSLFMP